MPSSRSFLLAGLLLCGGACSIVVPSQHRQNGMKALAAANYREAWQEFEKALEAEPDNRELQRLAKEAYLLVLIDEQRRLLFSGDELRALDVIARVLAHDPGNEIALAWQAKVRSAKGRELVDQGKELLAQGKLSEAQVKFQQAMEFVPGDDAAREGLLEIARFHQDARELAGQHYNMALSAREELDWTRVSYHARVTAFRDPAHGDAPDLVKLAARKVAERQREWAQEQERLRLWGAAANAWKKAGEMATDAKLDWAAEAKKKRQELDREAQAARIFHRAEIKIAAKRFAEARELLAEADKLCSLDRSYLNELGGYLRAQEAMEQRRQARLFELDHRFEEALALYEKLGEEDTLAAARIVVIKDLLARCAKRYEAAEKAKVAGKLDEARALWTEILSDHSRYRDVHQLLHGKR